MPLHNLLIFVGFLVFEMSAILIVARRGGKSLVTEYVQPVQPYERLTCEMEPAEMLDSHTRYGIDAVDIAQDELEANGDIFERYEVEALLALKQDKQRLEAR